MVVFAGSSGNNNNNNNNNKIIIIIFNLLMEKINTLDYCFVGDVMVDTLTCILSRGFNPLSYSFLFPPSPPPYPHHTTPVLAPSLSSFPPTPFTTNDKRICRTPIRVKYGATHPSNEPKRGAATAKQAFTAHCKSPRLECAKD